MGRDRSRRPRTSSRGALIVSFGVLAITGCFQLKADVDVQADAGFDPLKSDFVVDPSGATAGSYPSITSALAAANASTADAKVIHVLPGTYGSVTESFPLVFRGGISIEGSTDGPVSIVGVGVTSFSSPPSSNGSVSAAFVVGDSVRTTRISNLAFKSPASAPLGTEAIVCDRGNAGVDETPNVILDHVTLKGFEVGVRAIAFPDQPGCHVQAVASTFEDGGFGVLAQGQAKADGTPISVVTVHLGDGSVAGGNVFRRLAITSGSHTLDGAALYALDAVVGITADHNTFTNSDIGIFIEQGSGADATRGAKIESNDFGPLQNIGVGIYGKGTISLLADNHFHDIALNAQGIVLSNNNPWSATAVLVDPQQYGAFGAIVARHNSFAGCAIAVHVRGAFGNQAMTPEVAAGIDFGNAASPGANDFRCNSAPRQQTNGVGLSFGGDVFFHLAAQTTPLTMPFLGNSWDHAPPTARVGQSSNEQGIDVLASQGVTLDTSGATVSTSACPPANYHGP